jgi:hypothetical protein
MKEIYNAADADKARRTWSPTFGPELCSRRANS